MTAITCVLFNPAIDHVLEVPGFRAGGTFQASHTTVVPAGKAISVALGLRLLGHAPRVVALVGARELGTYERFLDDHDLHHELLPVGGETRRHVTIIDPASQATTHVRQAGFHVHGGIVDEILAATCPGPGSIVAWSGSLPPGIPAGATARFINACREAGATTFVDTSGDALRAISTGGTPWCIKINEHELASLDGEMARSGIGEGERGNQQDPLGAGAVADRARHLLQGGTSMVAVTLGKAGAVLATARGTLYGRIDPGACPPPSSTVGAGDAFLAAMIDGLVARRDDVEVLRHAIAVATASTLTRVAGTFDPDVARSLLPRVAISPAGNVG